MAMIGGFPNQISANEATATIGMEVIEREAGSVEEGEKTGAERPDRHRLGIGIFDSPPLEPFILIFNASRSPLPASLSMTARNKSSI